MAEVVVECELPVDTHSAFEAFVAHVWIDGGGLGKSVIEVRDRKRKRRGREAGTVNGL